MQETRDAALRALLKCCWTDLGRLVACGANPEEHLSLPLSVISLAECQPELAAALYARPVEVLSLLDDTAVEAQEHVIRELEAQLEAAMKNAGPGPGPLPAGPLAWNIYSNVHIRLTALPSSLDPRPSPLRPPLSRLGCTQLYQLLSVSGTVVRAGAIRMWANRQWFECTRCKERFPVKCSLDSGGAVELPEECPCQQRSQCTGNKFRKVPDGDLYSGYQEVRLQAATACLGLGEPPASLTVVLQDELADSVRPGDTVEVVGVLVPRWLSTTPGQRCELELVLLANNLLARSRSQRGGQALQQGHPQGLLPQQTHAAGGSGPDGADICGAGGVQVPAKLEILFDDFWAAHASRPMLGRNKILAGVCPGVAGMLTVKLAALLVLAGGVRREEGGMNTRGELHLLLVGDPGVGKSQIMKWACRASPGRAVMTTGRGSSGAGLTVAAVREGNSWALEAGALVLADGGLCCIDEFDGIRPTERAVVHEAMEQQTVHVAKAGLVTSLSTRTAIIGAINPRPGTTPTASRPLTEVTGLEGPLLSRFDMVLLLADPRQPDWDKLVAGHVLARSSAPPGALGSDSDTTGASGSEPVLALPAPEDLKAPLSEDPLVADEEGAQKQSASAFQPGLRAAGINGGQRPAAESRMSIAERVAAKLKPGSATGVFTGAGPAGQAAGNTSPSWSHGPAAFGGYGKSCEQQTSHASGAAAGNGGGGGGGRSAWTLEVIRAYIAWVRRRPPPVMSQEAEQVLVAYYGAMRRAEERSASRSTIRALESLIRVSQSHARLLCSERVELRDAVVAVVLADSSTQLLHVPGGESVTCARFPADPDADLTMQQRVVLTALGIAELIPQLPMLPAPPTSPPFSGAF